MFSAEAGEGFPSSRVDELLPKEYEGEESDFASGGQNQGGRRARGGPMMLVHQRNAVAAAPQMSRRWGRIS